MYSFRNNRCGCQNGIIMARERTLAPFDRREFSCNLDRQVIKHQHVVKHRHEIINEYDVIHEHDYYYRDVVKNREVVRHHEQTPHDCNYCGNDCDCIGGVQQFFGEDDCDC